MKRTHFVLSGKEHDLGLLLTWVESEGHDIVNLTQYIFAPDPLFLRFSLVIHTASPFDVSDIQDAITAFNQSLAIEGK